LSLVSACASWFMQPVLAQSRMSTPSTLPGATTSGQTVPGQTPGATGPLGQNTPDAMSAKIDDKKFAKDAALGGMAEVQLGKLATEKASRDDIKQFGQKMVDEHTKANDQLKEVATKDNIPIPDALDSKHQSRIDKLSKLSGQNFDKAFVKDQIKDHEATVRDFSAEAQNGTDANVKTFASNMLPTLQQHLDQVKDLNKSEKNQAKSTDGK
jgi:putative membrane protein